MSEQVNQEDLESDEELDAREREWKDCPRCKTKKAIWSQDLEPECGRCYSRDREERDAWVAFASARLTPAATDGCLLYFSSREARDDADDMLAEFRKRFPYPGREDK